MHCAYGANGEDEEAEAGEERIGVGGSRLTATAPGTTGVSHSALASCAT